MEFFRFNPTPTEIIGIIVMIIAGFLVFKVLPKDLEEFSKKKSK